MNCKQCNSENIGVIDSRPALGSKSIRRRRLCASCGLKFTTYEITEDFMNEIKQFHISFKEIQPLFKKVMNLPEIKELENYNDMEFAKEAIKSVPMRKTSS